MRSQTTMSVIDRYLSKYAKGELITQKMLQQNCRLSKDQASRYLAYCLKMGIGKKTVDGLGFSAMLYTPDKDQRTRTIDKREDANNAGKKRGVQKPRTYVRKKLEEFHVTPGPLIPPPKPAYVPPPVYAADPVMLDKLDTLAAGINLLALKLDVLIKVWSTES